MATSISPSPLLSLSIARARITNHPAHIKPALAAKPAFPTRRHLLFLLAAAPALTARERATLAEDIPLFGLRKKLRKVEEEAEELVREGFETAEKGLETAEKGIVAAERGIEAAEKGVVAAERVIEGEISFGGLAQAGALAGAEVVGVLVATSIVNGILGPEGKKS